jgi:DNA topoisomerase-1
MDAGEEASPRNFPARLIAVDGARLATGRDFDSTGQLKGSSADIRVLAEADAQALAQGLSKRDFKVSSVEEKPYTRKPYAPFMTSTLQQEAGRKLRFTSERTMRIAQKLYENGYITYMRTDSTTLSETAISAARSQATQLYGKEYVSPSPRQYTRKVKNAQEAHEAIRPAGDTFRTPGQVANQLSSDEFRLYELVWQRTLASQMSDAVGTTVSIRIGATSASNESVVFTTSGRTITFPGFLRAYVEDTDEADEKDDVEKRLPQLTRGDGLDPREFEADGHSTSPPARYTEPSLVKAMEELGVGRPSTYASIMQTIQDRGYVWKKGPALVPTWTAFAVIGLLESYFGRLVDYGFTASVENDLDDIANGERSRVDWLRRFYFGADDATDAKRISAQGGLKRLIESRLEEIDARGVNSIPLGDTGVMVRVGRYGPYLQRGSDEESQRASVPEDLAPDELTPEKVEELLSAPSGDIALGALPDGREITARSGRYGPYVTDGEKSASLFKSMALDTVTLADAEKLLTLPRTLGQLDGEDVTAQNGRYGPYIKKGSDSRSIDNEDQLFTITLDEAAAILAQPKQRGRRAAAAPPLKELGKDPVSGNPMVVKDGRFGPYVTDGETNASLRRGDSIEELTDERAAELLADRRARGPAKKAPRKAAKKTAKKATARKTTAKKSAAKKAAAKKS